jgi:hypothetical protein
MLLNSQHQFVFPSFFDGRHKGFLTIAPAQESILSAFIHAAHICNWLVKNKISKPPLANNNLGA